LTRSAATKSRKALKRLRAASTDLLYILVEEFDLAGDPTLVGLAEIVHAADVDEDIDSSPEGRGLSAIAHGFALLHGTNDHKKIVLETPMYDALYAWCTEQHA
jgi:hypothetical protein